MFRNIPILITVFKLAQMSDYDVEILPEVCDCRDWYGGCRVNGEKWIDDDVWIYACDSTDKSDAKLQGCKQENTNINPGENVTIDGLWYSCMENDRRLEFETEPFCDSNGTKQKVGQEYRDGTFQWLCLSTGRWITGCYYSNETHSDILLRVGENAYNGLIEHVCSKKQEYPAIVQYYTQVRKDVAVKHPTNKGINKNFVEPLQKLIKEDQNVRWLHNSSEYFVKNGVRPFKYTRYLPASRKPLGI